MMVQESQTTGTAQGLGCHGRCPGRGLLIIILCPLPCCCPHLFYPCIRRQEAAAASPQQRGPGLLAGAGRPLPDGDGGSLGQGEGVAGGEGGEGEAQLARGGGGAAGRRSCLVIQYHVGDGGRGGGPAVTMKFVISDLSVR